MKNLLFLLTFWLSLLVACTSVNSQGTDVAIATSRDEVLGCEALGTVKTGTNSTQTSAYNSLRNQAAVKGGDVIFVESYENVWGTGTATVFKCDPNTQAASKAALAEQTAALEARANQQVFCQAGTDCEYKWGRALQWIQNESAWKFRNVTENLLTTEGPLNSPRAAFEVTRIPTGDGRTYQIAIKAWCGRSRCIPSINQLRADFFEFVIEVPTLKP